MADTIGDPALATCFTVKIDGCDLGTFMSCDGLSVEVQVESREEGGNPFFIHQLPGRMKYTNVKLTRPINADTAKVTKWLASMATAVRRTSAEIAALRSDGTVVATWSLTSAFPVRWTGPSMSVDTLKAATETLELAHHGFLFDTGPGRN